MLRRVRERGLTGTVSDQNWALVIGLGTYVVLRVVDYFLPKGRHWKLIDRWSELDNPHHLPPKKPEEEKQQS